MLDSASISASGGNPPFEYYWIFGNDTVSTTNIAYDLVSGDYTIEVWDANNCMNDTLFVVEQPEMLVIDSVITTESVCQDSTGTATVYASGGTPFPAGDPYLYSWGNSDWLNDSTSQTITNLWVDFYYITVEDANGCQVGDTIAIEDTSALEIDIINIVDLTCPDTCTGSAEAVVVDSTVGNYGFNWSNGDITPVADGLCAEWYKVIVLDAQGCANADSVSITDEDALSAEFTDTTHLT